MTALADAKSHLAEAHRLIIVAQREPGHSPTEDAPIDAIHALGAAMGAIVDVCEELNGLEDDGK
jgi:hypothetical protein